MLMSGSSMPAVSGKGKRSVGIGPLPTPWSFDSALERSWHLCPWDSPEYWSGSPCPPPGDLPGPGMEPTSLMPPALAGRFFTTSTTWEALKKVRTSLNKTQKYTLHSLAPACRGRGPRCSTGKLSLHSCGHAEILSAGPQPSLLTLPVLSSSSSESCVNNSSWTYSK